MKLLIAFFAVALPGLALAQTPATPAAPRNLLRNGGFESFYQSDNLWDGVSSDSHLTGWRDNATATNESGAVGPMAMPVSVQVGDLNGDGLLDLLTSDPLGYFRIYFNSGSKTEPKFTHCEMIPVYLSRYNWDEYGVRRVYKAALWDMSRKGTLDMVLGDYGGEILLLKNTGSTTIPEFRQPTLIDSLVIKTTKNGNLWGNLFAPAVYDWDKDGKPDVLVGEGGYSANAVHLLLNQGSGSIPKFSEESRYYLAYGDGKEQLVPTVVDYNADGFPDLLVGDRKGTINLYLSDGAWSKNKEIKFKSTVSCGNVSTFNSCISPCAADFNGDGLFDLVIGKTNGRIAVAYNKGTATEPKFDAPVDLKGEDVWNRSTTRVPSDWTIDFGSEKGNFYGYGTVVTGEEDKDAAPTEGKHALKFAYLPPLNKIVKLPPFVLTGSNNAFFDPDRVARPYSAVRAGTYTDSNMVIIRKTFERSEVKPMVNYTFSLKAKGRGVKNAHWTFANYGHGVRAEARIQNRNERGGGKVTRDEANEELREEGDFQVSTAWNTTTRPITFKFVKEKELNDPEHFKGIAPPTYSCVLEIRATLTPGDGVCYFDDVQLIEKK